MNLSIIFPALNEAARIENTLISYAELFGPKIPLIIIDNGSIDNTKELVEKLQIKYSWIEYFYYDHALGKGGAVYEGFNKVNTEYVGFTDCDGAIKSEEFQKLVDRINDSDLIIASRWIKGASILIPQSFLRVISGRIFNLLVNLLFGLNIKDTQCGAKIIRKAVFNNIKEDLAIKRWAFDVDLLVHVKKVGFKIIEIPINWENHKGSKSASYKSLISAVSDIIMIKFKI